MFKLIVVTIAVLATLQAVYAQGQFSQVPGQVEGFGGQISQQTGYQPPPFQGGQYMQQGGYNSGFGGGYKGQVGGGGKGGFYKGGYEKGGVGYQKESIY